MATGSVYVDAKFTTLRGQAVVIGRIKVGQTATINAKDIELRTIRNFVVVPYGVADRFVAGSIGSTTSKHYFRRAVIMGGSLGSQDVLDTSTGAAPTGAYVQVNSYLVKTFGSITMRSTAAQGTKGIYFGTQPGSLRASYWAIGR